MGKPKRKPRPSPPKWYWWIADGCWWCKNRNNCNQCKELKRTKAYEMERRRRQDKKELRDEMWRSDEEK